VTSQNAPQRHRRRHAAPLTHRATQATLNHDPEQATAPRDHASRKAIDAFRRFEVDAKGSKTPLAITIRLKPDNAP
jgi:hypothetical protein